MGTKIVKGYWKCEYCGTYDIDGLIDNCPNCGKQKSHNIKHYMKPGVVEYVTPEELEKAAYNYVADFGTAGEMHMRGGVGKVIESCVFTKEKAEALGIPPEILPEGWWVGFRIEDEEVWEKIKSGEYTMFSIGGKAVREPTYDKEELAEMAQLLATALQED